MGEGEFFMILAFIAFYVLPIALTVWFVRNIVMFFKSPKGSEERAKRKRGLIYSGVSVLGYLAVMVAIIALFAAAIADM